MSICFLFMGCLTLYGKSTYFPDDLIRIRKILLKNQSISRSVGYFFLLLSSVLCIINYGVATGILVFLMAMTMTLSVLIIIVPIHKNYLYVMASICLLAIVFENVV